MEKMKMIFGQQQFVVDPNSYTYDKVEQLTEKITDIRRAHSLFSKYPLNEGESREKWRERIEPLMEKELVRKEGEAAEDHLKRLFDTKVDAREMTFEIVEAIGETFKLAKPAKEDLRACNYLKLRTFIYNVLNLADIPNIDEFYPKRQAD